MSTEFSLLEPLLKGIANERIDSKLKGAQKRVLIQAAELSLYYSTDETYFWPSGFKKCASSHTVRRTRAVLERMGLIEDTGRKKNNSPVFRWKWIALEKLMESGEPDLQLSVDQLSVSVEDDPTYSVEQVLDDHVSSDSQKIVEPKDPAGKLWLSNLHKWIVDFVSKKQGEPFSTNELVRGVLLRQRQSNKFKFGPKAKLEQVDELLWDALRRELVLPEDLKKRLHHWKAKAKEALRYLRGYRRPGHSGSRKKYAHLAFIELVGQTHGSGATTTYRLVSVNERIAAKTGSQPTEVVGQSVHSEWTVGGPWVDSGWTEACANAHTIIVIENTVPIKHEDPSQSSQDVRVGVADTQGGIANNGVEPKPRIDLAEAVTKDNDPLFDDEAEDPLPLGTGGLGSIPSQLSLDAAYPPSQEETDTGGLRWEGWAKENAMPGESIFVKAAKARLAGVVDAPDFSNLGGGALAVATRVA